MVNVELYNDDCLVVMRQLIERGIKVDAIIADIPYGIHNNKFDTLIPFTLQLNVKENNILSLLILVEREKNGLKHHMKKMLDVMNINKNFVLKME